MLQRVAEIKETGAATPGSVGHYTWPVREYVYSPPAKESLSPFDNKDPTHYTSMGYPLQETPSGGLSYDALGMASNGAQSEPSGLHK